MPTLTDGRRDPLDILVSCSREPLRTFWHVTFPLIRPGLAAGAIFAFVISLDNVPVSVFLVDAQTTTRTSHWWHLWYAIMR